MTDLEDTESVFHEFDSIIFERATAETLFGLLDASSLLWQLNTMGIEVAEERWKKVTDALATHVNNHRSPWLVINYRSLSISHRLHYSLSLLLRFDAHIMMDLAHGKVSESTARLTLAQEMIKVVLLCIAILSDTLLFLYVGVDYGELLEI